MKANETEYRIKEREVVKQSFSSITPRSVVIAFVFLTLITIGTQNSDLPEYWWMLSSWVMPSATGLLLVLLMAGSNRLLRKFPKITPFNRTELIVGYVVIMVGGYIQTISVVGFSTMAFGIPWYAAMLVNNPTYGPALQRISNLLVIKDTRVALGFWEGGSAGVPWGQLVVPIVSWTAFWSVLLFLMVCLATLFRKQWTEHERMTYPLTIPVVAVINGSTYQNDLAREDKHKQSLWRNRILYIGMIYPIVFGGINLLAGLFPAVPAISGMYEIHELFTEPPWDALSQYPGVQLNVRYPAIIGVAYLLNLQLLFSLWSLYFIAYRLPLVAFRAVGYELPIIHLLPFEIGRGAYIGITIMLIWGARHELKAIFKKACVGTTNIDDANEPVSFRVAVFGAGISIIFAVLFARYLLSMSPHIIGYFFFMFFAATIGYARLRAQAGYPHGQALSRDFYPTMLRGMGKEFMTANDALGMRVCLQPMESGMIASGMGMALESFTFADSVNMRRRDMTKLFMGAVVAALVIGYVTAVIVTYRIGANNVHGYYHFTKSQVWYQYQHPGYPTVYKLSIAIGVVLSSVLWFLNVSLTWWPLYPVALGIVSADWMRQLWFSFFIAWFVKFFVLRYGGYTLEQRLRPFFYGLILGDMMIGTLSTMIMGARALML